VLFTQASIKVTDTGIGIAPDRLAKLFVPFHSTEGTSGESRRGQGTRLGLSIVKVLVEGQGGRLAVQTELGKGTTFEFILPSGERRPDMSKNVFLVEDDSEMRRITRLLLERAGCIVEESSPAEEVQAEIAKKQPDLLLSDIELPGMSGIQLCERLRNDPRTADLPIILLTVRRSDMDKVKGLRTGADDYITKPFVPQELLARVESVLRRFH
jgi:CheY-like chemotaxis protein